MNQPSLHTFSLCIVTNALDDKLRNLLNAATAGFHDILIGYNGPDRADLPSWSSIPGVRLIALQWEGYSATKNKLAQLAQNDWICSLDSDEIPDQALGDAIRHLSTTPLSAIDIYAFRRLSFFEGRLIRHGAWGRDRVARLYNRQYVQWQADPVHETLAPVPPAGITLLPGILYHYTADTAGSFIAKNKQYALLSADKYHSRGKKSPLYKRWLSPLFTFVKEYFFQGGFLDGKAGWKIARINALYTYWKYRFLRENIRRRHEAS